MLPPERQDRQPPPDTLPHRLGQTARHLLSQVEHDTRHPIILRLRSPDLHGSYAHITYATGDEPHTIFIIIPEAIPSLDHLVSHECLHALRLFAQPDDERLMAYTEPAQQQRVARSLVPAIRKHFQHFIPAEEMAGIYQCSGSSSGGDCASHVLVRFGGVHRDLRSSLSELACMQNSRHHRAYSLRVELAW